MNKIENASRKSPFLTDNKTNDVSERSNIFSKDSSDKTKTKDVAQSDAKVSIPEATKLFSQIKKVADATTEVDNSGRIQSLKSRIEKGEYAIDDNKLAENISRKEFQVWSE